MIEQILQLHQKFPDGWYNKIRFNPQLNRIFQSLPGKTPSEKIFLHFNPHSLKTCIVCNKPTKFDSTQNEYKKFCSCSCRAKHFKSHLNGYKSPEVIKKRIASIKASSDTIVKKSKQTKLKRYGNKAFSLISQKGANKRQKTLLGKLKYDQLANTSLMVELHHNQGLSAATIGDMIGVSPECSKRWLVKNDIYQQTARRSFLEIDICNFLDKHNIKYETNAKVLDNKRSEVDILIPDHNIGIEVCGIYWHSDINNDRSRANKTNHFDKFIECSDKGIHLLTFFENEILFKKDIVLSIIANKLHINENKIFARKTVVKEVDKQQAKTFLNDNHIQQSKTHINIGLYHNDELIMLATFGKPRYNKKYQYELLRCCSKKHTTVIGGLSKIFKFFKTKYNPSSIITYCDLRYGDGSSYVKSGFKFSHNSTLGYYYFDKKLKCYHRSTFTKQNIVLKHGGDRLKTETENMEQMGFYRLWDCGNRVYVWSK